MAAEAVPSFPDAPKTKPAFDKRAAALLGPLPVGRKLSRSTLFTAGIALLTAALLFVLSDVIGAFRDTTKALASTARVLAQSAHAPVLAGDSASVAAMLDAQLLAEGVSAAAVYLPDGTALARRDKSSANPPPEKLAAPARSGLSPGIRHIDFYQPIGTEGGRIATLLVRGNLGLVTSGIKGSLITCAVVLVAGFIAAARFARRFHAVVAEPIAALARTATEVSTERDFQKRAVKCFDDEIGTVAETLNDVCEEVEKREAELQRTRSELEARLEKAHAELESSVLARTHELEEEIEDRKKTEEAMKDSETRYRNLFENNPMPMFVMHLETLTFVAVNYAAVKHYGYPMEEFRRLALPLITDGADAMTVMRTFRSNAKSFDAGEWKHRKKSGEIVDMQLTAHAIIFGGQVAKIVLANDVTERNRAQRELEELHKKLVTASRQAGQAEVATGVLHNVGNVLNSVNVSATILENSVKGTKATGIRKVAELLNANRADLPALFADGGKGRVLPDYLSKLADQIEAEQTERLAELAHLTGNIAHIKDVVANQQSYAKAGGLTEVRHPRALIDEAARMTASDMRGAGVTVTVECPEDVPDVCSDPHKVLQILVNLLTNARHAVETMPEEMRRVTIGASYSGGTRAAITVQDTGCGIPGENLTRIFNHGFTTKSNGHGFGLHTAANAAKEMHGSLTAASEGPGTGATFTLELPISVPEENQEPARCAA